MSPTVSARTDAGPTVFVLTWLVQGEIGYTGWCDGP
jgi:hypothetical protein